ncbi:MAG: MliC family protein [Rhodospirillales bacterium]
MTDLRSRSALRSKPHILYPTMLMAVAALPAICAAQPAPAAIRYVCTDGKTVVARYPDQTTALLEIDGHELSLSLGPSADGARYIGHGWQWWAKGMRDGTLAPLPPGQTIVPPGVDCHAPS